MKNKKYTVIKMQVRFTCSKN